jgi:hypothetical protein
MPVLPSEYLSTWYRLRDSANNSWLVQSWSEHEIQQTQVKQLIQGDIGVRAMDIGGHYFEHSIQTPVLLIETPLLPGTVNNNYISSTLSMLAVSFNQARSPIYTTSQLNYILKSGSIKITEAGVTVDVGLYSDIPSALSPVYLPTNVDYIARPARWYDCNFYIQDDNLSSVYQVKSGTITFVMHVELVYFIGTDQQPYFVVQGYEVNGDLEMLVSPAQYEALLHSSGGVMQVQSSGNLNASVAQPSYLDRQVALSIGNASNKSTLSFGRAMVVSEVDRSLQPSQVTTLKMSFKSFMNSSTPLTLTEQKPYVFTT